MFKNLKIFDWVCIVVTCLVLFYHNAITTKIKEHFIVNPQVQGKGFWKSFRKIAQAIIAELPGGGIINTIWNMF